MNVRAIHTALIPLLAIGLYLALRPGLQAEFQFDDIQVFEQVRQMLNGQLSLGESIVAHRTGPLGRLLTNASFSWEALMFGLSPAIVHLTNAVIHLFCGYWVWRLAAHLFRQLPMRRLDPADAALILAAVWLLTPMFVTTVLYGVQRMAQFAALFSLIALVAYFDGRNNLARNRRRGAAWRLFGVYPVALGLGMLAKENAACTLLLTLFLEWALFRRDAQAVQPDRLLRGFLFMVGGLLVVGLAFVLFKVGEQMADYSVRSFSLFERLLSEARILWIYAAKLLVPAGTWGLVHDDFPISSQLISPPTTLLSIAAWAGALSLLLRPRGSLAFALGVCTGFFLLGHAVESSVLPLELYFEHRNYLPGIGVIAAAIVLVDALAKRVSLRREVVLAGAVAWCCVLAVVLHSRAVVWADQSAMIGDALAEHPNSRRLLIAIAEGASRSGRHDEALDLVDRAEAVTDIEMAAVLLSRMQVLCAAGRDLDSDLVQRLQTLQDPAITPAFLTQFDRLANDLYRGRCPAYWAGLLGQLGERALAGTRTISGGHREFVTRLYLGRLLMWVDNPAAARDMLEAALAASHTQRNNRQSAHLELARVAISLEEWARARHHLDCYRQLRPERGLFLLELYSRLDYIVSRQSMAQAAAGGCRA